MLDTASPIAGARVSSGLSSKAVTPLPRHPPHIPVAAAAADTPPGVAAACAPELSGSCKVLLLLVLVLLLVLTGRLLPLTLMGSTRVKLWPVLLSCRTSWISTSVGGWVRRGEPSSASKSSSLLLPVSLPLLLLLQLPEAELLLVLFFLSPLTSTGSTRVKFLPVLVSCRHADTSSSLGG
jgi:hypothetical protein